MDTVSGLYLVVCSFCDYCKKRIPRLRLVLIGVNWLRDTFQLNNFTKSGRFAFTLSRTTPPNKTITVKPSKREMEACYRGIVNAVASTSRLGIPSATSKSFRRCTSTSPSLSGEKTSPPSTDKLIQSLITSATWGTRYPSTSTGTYYSSHADQGWRGNKRRGDSSNEVQLDETRVAQQEQQKRWVARKRFSWTRENSSVGTKQLGKRRQLSTSATSFINEQPDDRSPSLQVAEVEELSDDGREAKDITPGSMVELRRFVVSCTVL